MNPFLSSITLVAVFGQPVFSQISVPGEAPRRIDTQHLPNAIQVTSTLISGGLPEGEEAFAELKKLGIKTIISVDGAKPDVASARKYGMKYVHLPHGYDGISEERGHALAKALLELEKPIYLHCHHGKHRSPAASAVACIANGCMTNEQGKALLQLAGTNANYWGLWRSVSAASSLPQAELKKLEVAFPETAEIPRMAKAMVDLDVAFEAVKKLKTAGWKADGVQNQKARSQLLLLREHFTELLRLEETSRHPPDFAKHFAISERASEKMLQLFSAAPLDSDDADTTRLMDSELSTVSVSCTNCHRSYRDKSTVP